MLVMVAKSTAVAFMMRAENGCFQDLETSWWRSGKKGSGLWGWAGARLVKKRSSSLDWDPPPNPAPVYPPREWPRPTARCSLSCPLGGRDPHVSASKSSDSEAAVDKTSSSYSPQPKEIAP